MTNALEVRNLTKVYPTFSLKNVSFAVPTGYIMGFIGPNGAGKTTTIKSILNLINYPAGQINIFGMDSKSNTAEINEKIGVAMDSPFYLDEWKISDVEQAVSPFYRNWDSASFATLLQRFNIDRSKKVGALSRGMKVKLMVAVALSHGAELLILDEPTSGLDPVARDELCDLLAEFVTDESHSVLFSTHITSDLERVADYVTFILDGRIVYSGPKDELLERYARVIGDRADLTDELRQNLVGVREYRNGFEGMIETDRISTPPANVIAERISLDEIIVFMNKGNQFHE